ncbi:tryptophan synthase subunit alpha [Oceanobacillus sp. Castelsardo]|uniref:tryptophan synthase subunit alpha n=1 Tax=Oceanobacillus sp. Castelsardo TaxID=1851204 RepID=UPI0008393470|nr:tryptophan synthase subunit alpha [Oceanobacillus sp. Castelsardo]
MGSLKLEQVLQQKQAANQNLFVPYIMAGDGGLDILEERINFLQESGASAIELGIPFSDPIADGPTIQEAGIRALANGTSLKSILEFLKSTKEDRSIPIILMTYVNPIYHYGMEQFAEDCADSGVDGIIIPDVPMEEEGPIATHLSNEKIAFIRLAAMTSPEVRLKEIARKSEGFLYAVAVMGTTGVRSSHSDNVKGYLENLKKYSSVPVLAGFGVSSVEQAHELSSHCDGVIVGSKIVDLLYQGKHDEVRNLIQSSVNSKVQV